MTDLRTLRTFKARYEALMAEAPTEGIRNYMADTIHDEIDPAIRAEESLIEYAVMYESRGMGEGMGGNDPANARAGWAEYELPRRQA